MALASHPKSLFQPFSASFSLAKALLHCSTFRWQVYWNAVEMGMWMGIWMPGRLTNESFEWSWFKNLDCYYSFPWRTGPLKWPFGKYEIRSQKGCRHRVKTGAILFWPPSAPPLVTPGTTWSDSYFKLFQIVGAFRQVGLLWPLRWFCSLGQKEHKCLFQDAVLLLTMKMIIC